MPGTEEITPGCEDRITGTGGDSGAADLAKATVRQKIEVDASNIPTERPLGFGSAAVAGWTVTSSIYANFTAITGDGLGCVGRQFPIDKTFHSNKRVQIQSKFQRVSRLRTRDSCSVEKSDGLEETSKDYYGAARSS